MGQRFSRNLTAKEAWVVLEGIEEKLIKYELNLNKQVEKKEKALQSLLAYTIGFYVLIGSYLCFTQPTTEDLKRVIIYCLVSFPFAVYFSKEILNGFYQRREDGYRTLILKLKNERKRVLDHACETESYKVVKQMLDRFDTDSAAGPNYRPTSFNSNLDLKRRTQPGSGSLKALPAPPMPFKPSLFERFVEVLVGDAERVALICPRCCNHNGTAMKEESEFVSYRCIHCGMFIPSKKQKPVAPLLVEYEEEKELATEGTIAPFTSVNK